MNTNSTGFDIPDPKEPVVIVIMDDVDEGIGSNDGIEDKSLSVTTTIDHLKALNQLKRLNGESVTGSLCNGDGDSDQITNNGSYQNGETCLQTLAEKAALKTEFNVSLQKLEHEVNETSGISNPQSDEKDATLDNKSDSDAAPSDKSENHKNGCTLNGSDKLSREQSEKRAKLRYLLANAKNSLRRPTPDRKPDTVSEETKSEKSDTDLSEDTGKSQLDIEEEEERLLNTDTPENGVNSENVEDDEEQLLKPETPEQVVNPEAVDDDDDVIFEGESKVVNGAEDTKETDSSADTNPTDKPAIKPTVTSTDIPVIPESTEDIITDSPSQKESETISEDIETISEDPETISEDIESISEDPETVSDTKEDMCHEVLEESKADNESLKDQVDIKNDQEEKPETSKPEEDDDDVIFEGESKVDKQSTDTRPPSPPKDAVKSDDTVKETISINGDTESEMDTLSTKGTETSTDNKENKSPDTDDDDDVIFEKETKVDWSEKSIFRTNEDKVENGVTKTNKKESKTIESDVNKKSKPICDIKDNSDIESIVSVDSVVTKSTNSDGKRPAESVLIDSDSETKSTNSDGRRPAESVLIDSDSETKSTNSDRKKPAESVLIDSDSETKSTNSDRKRPAESVLIDSDSETKSTNSDRKRPAESVLIDSDSETKSTNSDRKRPAESVLPDSDSKRSKLEQVVSVPVVKTNVEEPPSIDLIDSDEEDMDTSEPVTKDVPTDKDNTDNGPAKMETKKMITLTEEELDKLIRSKLKACLAAQRDTLLAQMSQKLQHFQTNNDLWKRQVKDLQVKVNEATVLQQKHEKRKAHTAALRQITTRNVAVQVDDGRTSNAKTRQPSVVTIPSPSKPMSKTGQNVTSPVVNAPPGANGMIRLPIIQSSIAPPIQPSPVQQPQQQMVASDYKTPTVKSLLDTTRTQPTISSATPIHFTSTAQNFSVQYPQRVVTHNSTANTNFISLTTQGAAVPAGTKVVNNPKPGGSKIIDLTDDEPKVLATLPPGLTAVNTTTGVRTLLGQGSQFVRASFPNTPGTFQLVFPAGTQPIRPGTMITGLPQTMIQAMPQVPPTDVSNTPATNQVPGVTTIVNRPPPPPPLQTPAQVQSVTTKPPVQATPTIVYSAKHPAPFPLLPTSQKPAPKGIPPRPSLRVSRVNQGIVLSWNMTMTDSVAEVSSYQLFAYQETVAQPQSSLWKKVGDVKALPLPMACTLTQFQVGNKYHFAVRALDIHGRVSDFSDPSSLHMEKSAS